MKTYLTPNQFANLFFNLYGGQMIDAILKLTPFERWNLSVGKEYVDNMWSKTYPPEKELTPPDVLRESLKTVGFYA